ncbi:MAG: FAD-dependent oxidoreductase [Bilophila wadsworthia]
MDGIFVFLGQSPNNEWFKDAIALDDKGYILAGEDMSTNIPGVFGAGDINHKAVPSDHHGGQRRHSRSPPSVGCAAARIRLCMTPGEDVWGKASSPAMPSA